jgi:hypothetical protein
VRSVAIAAVALVGARGLNDLRMTAHAHLRGRWDRKPVLLVARAARSMGFRSGAGHGRSLFGVALRTKPRRCHRIQMRLMTLDTASPMARRTGADRRRLRAVAFHTSISSRRLVTVGAMARQAVAVLSGRAREVCRSIRVAFDASIRIGERLVRLVTARTLGMARERRNRHLLRPL